MFRRTVIAILLISWALQAFTQGVIKPKFGAINSIDGLSHNSVNDQMVDERGFLWIATMDGLNRYDGSRFELFRHVLGDSTSLPNNTVWTIENGRDNDILIGTASGLCRYSYATNQFERIAQIEGNIIVRNICVDNNDQIWVGPSNHDLLRIDHFYDGQAAIQTFPEITFQGTNSQIVQDHSDSNRVWFSRRGGILSYDLENQEITDWTVHIQHEDFNSSIISVLVQDSLGRLWIGTNAIGLFRFDPTSLETVQYLPDDKTPYAIGSSGVFDLLIDQQGRLWASSFGDGLSIMTDMEKGIFVSFKKKDSEKYVLKNNTLTNLFNDKDGRIWIGTHGSGIQYYDPDLVPFDLYRESEINPQSLTGNNITSIYEDDEGNTWVGTRQRGINKIKWNGSQIETLQTYTADERDPKSLNINSTNSYTESEQLGLVIGNRLGGINIYEKENDEFRDYFVHPGDADVLKPYHVNDMWTTTEDDIWLATAIGIYLWDSEAQELINYNQAHPELMSLNDVYCRFVVERAGVLWIGASNVGLWSWDIQENKLRKYDTSSPAGSGLNTNNLLCYHFDKHNKLWIGTWEGGLNVMDLSTKQFDYYTEEDGLSNSVVYSIQEDDEELLWLSTNNGIIRFDPETETFNSFGIKDGLQGEEYNASAGYRSNSTGRILFGGMNGLNQFDPSQIKWDTIIPDIYITHLLLYETDREHPIDLTQKPNKKEIIFSHRTYLLECAFGAPKLPTSNNVRFAYRVKGLSDKWIDLGQRKEFSLTNLAVGSYTLEIRAGLDGGRWNQNIKSIAIQSLPPWWRTWWAYLLYIAMISFILYLIYKSRVSQLIRYQKLRTQISSDLHDDVGTILSAMAFQTEILELEQDPSEKVKFKKITNMSRLALERMRDTVWAIDSRKDNVESLVDRMEDFLFDASGNQEISFDFNKNILSKDLKIRPDVRQTIYLVFKEAVTNALKHSNGDLITINLELQGKGFHLSVKDNGEVDPSSIKKSGLGLENMRARAEKVGASFVIGHDHGFTVEMSKA